MNKIRIMFFLLLVFSFNWATAQNSKAIDLELRRIENNLKNEFENSLKSLVGADTKFAVQLYFKPSALVKKEQAVSTSGSLDTFETGYMTLPVSDLKFEKAEKAEKEVSETTLKPFESFEVVLTLPDDMSVQKRNQIIAFTKSYFKQYSPKISEQKFIATKDAKDKKTDLDSDKKKSEESEKSEKSQPWKDWVYPVLILLGLFAVTLGIYLFSRSFGMGISLIADAIAQLRNIQIEQKLPLEEKPLTEDKSKMEFSHSISLFKDQKHKNLEIIEIACSTKPDSIVKAFNSDESDYWGAVWLLTEIKPENRLKLKNILGENFFRNLSSRKPNQFDPYNWLQDIAEKVTLFQIQGENEFESYLNQEEIRQLFLWDKEAFKTRVSQDSRPAAWKIAQDLLNINEFSILTEGLHQDIWKAIIIANEASTKDLKSVYSDYSKELSSDGKSQQSKLNLKKYKILVPELLKKYQQLSFLDDEMFLQEINQSQPELFQLLKADLLTLSDFKLIPAAFLKTFLSQLSTQQIFSLFVSLPEPEQAWIEGLIPDGNRKLIIQDLVSQASKMDKKTKMAALKETKTLFSVLKNCEKNNEFEYEINRVEEAA